MKGKVKKGGCVVCPWCRILQPTHMWRIVTHIIPAFNTECAGSGESERDVRLLAR